MEEVTAKRRHVMFGFFKKAKAAKELDYIIAEITMNMQNNYKDTAKLS